MEINIKWNICRVCLKEEQKKPPGSVTNEEPPMRHLFNEDKQLAKQIYECSGIAMKPNDSLPEKICKKCLIMVKHAANFRKTCRASNTYLQNLLQRTKSASTLFKPQWQTEEDEFEDDIISFDNEDEESQATTNPSTITKEASKQTAQLKPKATPLAKSSKKICQQSNSGEIKNSNDNVISPDDMMVDQEQEEEGNDLDNIVEEVLDNTEATENENILNKVVNIKSKSTQNFHINEVISENENDFEIEAAETTEKSDLKDDNEQFYYVVKDDDTNENSQQQQEEDNLQETEQEQLETYNPDDNNVQYIQNEQDLNVDDNAEEEDVDEEELLHLESDLDENQAQVSSTVNTKEDREEFVCEEEQNSNLSNETKDLQTEYIVDEYLLDDSNSNISSHASSVVVLNAKRLNSNRTKTNATERKVRTLKAKPKGSNSSKAVMNGMQVWICDLCGNHFANRQLFNAHMKIHRQEKNHECELCSKRFITACNLQAHMRIHTGEKPFECKYCGRRFSDRTSNLRHERIHTNEKPYQCNVCNKAFSLSTTLKKHMTIHTGERSYRCDLCAKSFKLPHQLKAHQNTSLHKAIEEMEAYQK
ncbi:uncharacterized protein ACRADG_000087 [Cochliomyia hominivorax]